MNIKIILISIFFSFNAFSKNECLSYYINNDLVLESFGNVDPSIKTLYILEIGKYCECESKIKDKYKSWIDFAFENPEVINDIKDSCSIENLSKENISIFFNINILNKYDYLIRDKILENRIQGITNALENSLILDYENCYYEKVVNNCFKVQSLRMAGQCIHQFFGIKKYNETFNYCSKFLYENKGIELSVDSLNFI